MKTFKSIMIMIYLTMTIISFITIMMGIFGGIIPKPEVLIPIAIGILVVGVPTLILLVNSLRK
jgi:hypothetical protein|tara:strand:- start:2142 stop:2330 length:189 start_codon:yes stop_codon:yes gene_type:complete